MKSKATLSLCLAIVFSITQRAHCQENDDDSTIIYSEYNKIYGKNSHDDRPRKLIEFKSRVSGLALYNDYLFVTVHNFGYEYSLLKRYKISINSTGIQIEKIKSIFDKNVFQVFVVEHGEDLLSMTLANGTLYIGRSDDGIWHCQPDEPQSCKTFFVSAWESGYKRSEIDVIDYSRRDNKIYLVKRDHKGYRWNHSLVSCSLGDYSCKKEDIYLKSWTTLRVAFDAIWIGELGKIRKCPFNATTGEFSINDLDCTEFHDFKKPVGTNIGASSKYLYVSLETRSSEKKIWRCDPNKQESCSIAFKFNHLVDVGTMIFF